MPAAARRSRRRSTGCRNICRNEELKIQQKDLNRLDRILGLLSSDNPGERASAAKAAAEFIKKHDVSWRELLEGRALPRGKRSKEIGIDYLEAAESRIRQLQTHNANLEKQVRRLKDKLEAIEDEQAAEQAGRGRR
jgi:hypothetical protein